jgi:hypothetical protein
MQFFLDVAYRANNRVTARCAFLFVFHAGFCGALIPESVAQLAPSQKKQPSRPALPVEIAEDVTVDLVETLFLFDRLFTKSATATSADYLKRVSEPSSKFYPDYLKYKQGRISRSELVGQLPHIAMIGDSVSKNFYISSLPSMFWRARTERRRDWFLDTDPSPNSVNSLFERLEPLTPLVATEYSTAGAEVDSGDGSQGFGRKLARTRPFSRQVNQILLSKRYPDLVLIWMGDNSLDWVSETPVNEREQPEKRLHEYAMRFREDYTRQVRRLILRAQIQDHRVAIVVFGIFNLDSFFKAREIAETIKVKNPKLFPYLEIGANRFPSLKPMYRANTIRLGLMMNKELRSMVVDLNCELENSPNVQLRYSDSLAKGNVDRVEWINGMDAWHPSTQGHSRIALAALKALTPSLHFLGISPKQVRSP